jgi:tRNA threonylcarbamoyladenosine biosynthesis protein TsaB
MKVLGVDTSTNVLSVAIVEDKDIISNLSRTLEKGHSSGLVPMIGEILKRANISLERIDGFAVGIGPGSFTGLRVGVTTMKTLAFSVDKPIKGLSSLDAIAYNGVGAPSPICPIVDAKRDQVYSAIYAWEGKVLKRLSNYLLIPIGRLLKKIKGEVLFLGDGIELYKEEIIKIKKGKAMFAPKSSWFPQASRIAFLGLEAFKRGEMDNPYSLVPMYLYPKECTVRK